MRRPYQARPEPPLALGLKPRSSTDLPNKAHVSVISREAAWVQGVSATVEKNPLVQGSTRGAPLTAHLNIEQRALARRQRSQGWSLRAIAKQVGCGHAGIEVMLRGQSREARPIEWVPRRGALSIEEREEILRGLSRGDSLSAIARQLGRCTSTVSREVSANGGRDDYRIWPAHQRARERARRPKAKKLNYAPLAKRVTGDLEKLWSPEEIALRAGDRVPPGAAHATQSRDHLPVPVCTGQR